MYKAKYLDLICRELIDTNSLGALSIMINAGSEVDFTFQDKKFSITWVNGKLKLESMETGEKQLFEEVSELIVNGTIDGNHLIEVWKDSKIDFVY